jgi:hypothetical protein
MAVARSTAAGIWLAMVRKLVRLKKLSVNRLKMSTKPASTAMSPAYSVSIDLHSDRAGGGMADAVAELSGEAMVVTGVRIGRGEVA